MIIFPKTLTFNQDEKDLARAFADKHRAKMNSYEGTYRGELAELCLVRLLSHIHDVVENDEDKTHQYEWDMKIDGKFVDIKTTTGSYITISNYTLGKKIDHIIYPCYKYGLDKMTLIGVINGTQVRTHATPSKFHDSNYISSKIIKEISQ